MCFFRIDSTTLVNLNQVTKIYTEKDENFTQVYIHLTTKNDFIVKNFETIRDAELYIDKIKNFYENI